MRDVVCEVGVAGPAQGQLSMPLLQLLPEMILKVQDLLQLVRT